MTTKSSAEGDTKASAANAVGVSPRYRRAETQETWTVYAGIWHQPWNRSPGAS